ncbi:MAG: helix-turn-helix transcriptional regulator [Candidatus Korobacteraceae bacterium]
MGYGWTTMNDMDESISSVAALMGDATRARMLLALLDGVALPAGELAMCANVAPQTASAHLSKLLEAKLLTLESQGRHRYYRLANAEVAAAMESLAAVAPPPRIVKHASSERLRRLCFARTCYSHLAGKLATDLNEALQRRGLLAPEGSKSYRVTEQGGAWFRELGIDLSIRHADRPDFARACLDWTERRHHLAGPLGTSLLRRLLELKWLVRMNEPRAVRVTHEGQRQLETCLGIKMAW